MLLLIGAASLLAGAGGYALGLRSASARRARVEAGARRAEARLAVARAVARARRIEAVLSTASAIEARLASADSRAEARGEMPGPWVGTIADRGPRAAASGPAPASGPARAAQPTEAEAAFAAEATLIRARPQG